MRLNIILLYLFVAAIFVVFSPVFNSYYKIYVVFLLFLVIAVLHRSYTLNYFIFFAVCIVLAFSGLFNSINTLFYTLPLCLSLFSSVLMLKFSKYIDDAMWIINLVTIPFGLIIYFLYLFGVFDIHNLFSYTYGPYTNLTAGFINFHLYIDNSVSGRFVGVGSEPGQSQVLWMVAILLAYKKLSYMNQFIKVSSVLAIILGRSPIGFMFLLAFGYNHFRRLGIYIIVIITFIFYFYWDIVSLALDKLSLDYIAQRFSREIALVLNGVQLLPNHIEIDVLFDSGAFSGAGQLLQRGGLLFFLMYSILIISSLMYSKGIERALVFSLILVFFTQSIMFNPFFHFYLLRPLYLRVFRE